MLFYDVNMESKLNFNLNKTIKLTWTNHTITSISCIASAGEWTDSVATCCVCMAVVSVKDTFVNILKLILRVLGFVSNEDNKYFNDIHQQFTKQFWKNTTVNMYYTVISHILYDETILL